VALGSNPGCFRKNPGYNYKTFKVPPYIISPLFTTDDILTLVSLRSRTVRGILCPVCGLHDDTLPALLSCPRLVSDLSSTRKVTDRTAKHGDILHEDVRIQKKITSLYTEMLEIRDRILDKMTTTPEDTGHLHSCIDWRIVQ
jgi:hypothetical protein